MKKKILILVVAFLMICTSVNINAFAQTGPYTYKVYTVKSGGSLSSVSKITGIHLDDLKSYNPHIKSYSWLSKGTKVYLPDVARSLYIQNEVIRLVNIERRKAGVKPLALDDQLGKVARIKSQDMASTPYFSHTSPRYGSAAKMVSSFGLKWRMTGENIASGYTTPAGVVKGWMNSPGHKRNMLSPRYNLIGVGVAASYKKNGRLYWTQEFIQTW
jgi:uncharacterized YkwD family protein